MTVRPVRFFHRGAVVELDDPPPTRSVLAWLREDRRSTGTKEGCAEGDCGACTVVLGDLDDGAPGGLRLTPANACIQFLPVLDGRALFTVEDLAPLAAPAQAQAAPSTPPLHPVQQALVDCHGSQCGFCTPGFAMSLWAVYESGVSPDRPGLADALAGNLCRCTGYRPILDAGQRACAAYPAARLDRAPVVQALRALAADPPLSTPGGFHAPRTLAQLAALREANPRATLLAGSTDVGLWVNKQFREPGEMIHTGRVAELRRLDDDGTRLRIGAAVTLEQAWSALAARHPALREVALRFAGPPVRHTGTMGGNVANGSPIGDSAPVLIALGAAIVLRRGERQRSMPLEDFYTGYMTNRLEPGEFVEALDVPHDPALVLRAYKLSKRFDCDISAVCAVIALDLSDDGTVRRARLAFGGLAATVRRAAGAEAALVGRAWDEAALQAAQAALADDFTPLSDLRASAGYRAQAAAALLRRAWLETRRDAPLPAAATRVWARA